LPCAPLSATPHFVLLLLDFIIETREQFHIKTSLTGPLSNPSSTSKSTSPLLPARTHPSLTRHPCIYTGAKEGPGGQPQSGTGGDGGGEIREVKGKRRPGSTRRLLFLRTPPPRA
jgi:hypothetical protein